jgi:hypothetical protein
MRAAPSWIRSALPLRRLPRGSWSASRFESDSRRKPVETSRALAASKRVEKRGSSGFRVGYGTVGPRRAACGVRRAADGLEVSHGGTEAQGPNGRGEQTGRGTEGIGTAFGPFGPWHPSDLGIPQTWASLRPGHPSDLGIPQTWASLRPENPSDLKRHKLRQPRAVGCSRSDAAAASAKKRDGFSRLLASFRVLASLPDFVFSSFLRACVHACMRACLRNPEPNRRLHHCSPTRFPEARKKRTPPGSTWRGS